MHIHRSIPTKHPVAKTRSAPSRSFGSSAPSELGACGRIAGSHLSLGSYELASACLCLDRVLGIQEIAASALSSGTDRQ